MLVYLQPQSPLPKIWENLKDPSLYLDFQASTKYLASEYDIQA